MERSARSPLFGCILSILCASCGGKDPGVDGSEIPIPFETLSGGVVFASQILPDSKGYDLLWAPAPLTPTTNAQPVTRLTHAGGNEWQPSVSRGGKGIVFVREDDGIFLISISGRVSRVTDTRDAKVRDTLPALSFDGNQVAWVREDLARPIGETGFYETFIMISTVDGKNARPVAPRGSVIQDAPIFEPSARASRLAWTEFDATSLTASGPLNYGIFIHDLTLATGRYVCRDPAMVIDNEYGPRDYRCFGQHIDWVKVATGDSNNPIEDYIVTGQELIEINVARGSFTTLWPQVVLGIQNQQLGTPFIAANESGFFPAFPLSISFSGGRFILDGVITPSDGDADTLAFFIADADGGAVWRLFIDGQFSDLDLANTSRFLFSVATPQLVP